ncbi:MAG: shikimate kinase [Bacillota bacterium]
MENIVLIGMPGCGKSTIGVVLAKVMGYHFIDSDLLIQERENRLLSQIIEEEGPDKFNQIENEVNAGIMADKAVIATGGSVIYGDDAMLHLAEIGVIVYIRLPLEELQDRLGDLAERGISMKEGQTLEDLYRERTQYYEKYAHIIIDTEGLSIREAVKLIQKRYKDYQEQGD